MTKSKRSWAPELDEALLRVMKQGHEKAAAFFAAYQRESGDTAHDIGGVAFRAIQMNRLLREYMTESLRRDLDRAASEARTARRNAKDAIVATPTPATKSPMTLAIVHDGREYINASEAAAILGCRTMQVRKFTDVIRWKTGIHPKGSAESNRKMYERASVVEFAANRGKATVAKATPTKPTAVADAPAPTRDNTAPIIVDGVAYVLTAGAAAILGVQADSVRKFHRELCPVYGITPDVAPKHPIYDRAAVVALVTRRAKEKAEAEARHHSTGDGEWMLDGDAVVTPKRAGEIVGVDARTIGSKYARKVVRRYHPNIRNVVYYTRASVDALRDELAAEAASKVTAPTVETAPVIDTVVPTSVPTSVPTKAPVRRMADLSLPEKLERLNRALAEGVIDEGTHLVKVRQIIGAQ